MAKGGSFERKVCYALTAWWTGDQEADVLFWRTAGSGGRATARGKKGKQTTAAHQGDLAALGEEGKELTQLITIECKRGYSRDRSTVADFLDRPATAKLELFDVWVEQARTAAKTARTPFWLIVHQRDRRESVVLMPEPLFEVLGGDDRRFRTPIVCVWGWTRKPDGSRSRLMLAAVTFSAFLDGVSRADIERLHKELT